MQAISRLVLAGLLATFAAACGAGPATGEDVVAAADAQTAGGPRDATAVTVAAALLAKGVISAYEAPMLVPLGTESGWTVMLTPGLPSATARLTMVVVGQPVPAGQVGASTANPIARWSKDQWTSSTDTAGQLYTVNTAPVLVFPLAQPTQIGNGAFLQAAVRVGGAWLSAGGVNYRFIIPSPNALSWVGGLTVGQQGVLRTIPGQSLFAGHDASVTLDTYPMLPGTVATLHWTQDNHVTVHDVPMDLAAVNVGAYGDDARWVATLPTGAMSAGPTIALWAEASSNGPGGTRWDSNNGQNYVASVAAPPQASWAQLGAYRYLTSQSGWYYGFASTLADPLSATPGDFQAYAASPSPAVEVFAQGITDAPRGAAACAGGFVRVEAWSPFFSGTPTGAWAAYALPFVETAGNNCRFKWLLQNTGFTQPPPGVSAPATGGYPVDGAYPYKLRISTDGGATWQWLGTAGLPGGGGNRTVNWVAPFHG